MSQRASENTWSDTRLVSECLTGNEKAWSALIGKYKNLIYSIPLKYGLPCEDAAEVFQGICVSLLSELPNLRQPKALPAWLIKVTYHRCVHWKRRQQLLSTEDLDADQESDVSTAKVPADQIHEVELEQKLREAAASLSPRCQRLIDMLFYQNPGTSYEEIARNLGLAKGSIGFIRKRCLEKLRKNLERAGFTG